MANKYANLIGTNKIKDEYSKINTGFDTVEADVSALKTRVEQIITTPIDGEAAAQEIVDARASAVKSKTFATLDARFEETEQDVESHMADKTPHPNIPAAQVYHWPNQSIPHATHTILAFADEVFDNDTIHDAAVNNSRLTCNTAGIYLITASVDFDITDVGSRNIAILRNGTQIVAQQTNKATDGTYSSLTVTAILPLNTGDYVEVDIFQTSGIAINVLGQENSAASSVFGMIRMV